MSSSKNPIDQSRYKLVIGLEIHCQINSKHKLFSFAGNGSDYDKESLIQNQQGDNNNSDNRPNSCITFLEMGTPGILPIVNKEPIELALRAGLAFNATINNPSYFDRKHYFYPDLPSGYQITQFNKPIIQNGYLDIETTNGIQRIRIKQMHLEADAGKNNHENSYSLLDYNRVAVGLIESVTEPDIHSAEEAVTFAQEFHNIMKYIGVCQGDMEKGEFRMDVNISVKDLIDNKSSNRVEIKNLNSFNNMAKAIEYEYQLHVNALQNNEIIPQSTRFFDANKGKTGLLRIKESANDYRYIVENDIPALRWSQDMMDEAQEFLKNILLPVQIRKMLMDKGLSLKQAQDISGDKFQWNYFKQLMNIFGNKINGNIMVKLYNLLTIDLANLYNKTKIFPWESQLTLINIGDLFTALENKTITLASYKELLEKLWHNSGDVYQLIKDNNMTLVDDSNIITDAVMEALKNNPQEVSRYKNGETKLLQFFVGQVMRITKGKGDHNKIVEILNNKLMV